MRSPIIIAAAVLALAAQPAAKTVLIPKGETATGRCVGVHDGDSMTVLIETPEGPRQAKIRLDGIDAPELGQAYSRKSKEGLSALVFDKSCDVESFGGDKYGRTIGRVKTGGTTSTQRCLKPAWPGTSRSMTTTKAWPLARRRRSRTRPAYGQSRNRSRRGSGGR